MRKTIAVLLISLVSITLTAQNDLEQNNLFGEIKSIKTTKYFMKKENDSLIVGKRVAEEPANLTRFNSDGYISNITWYDSDDEVSNIQTYTYKGDNLIKIANSKEEYYDSLIYSDSGNLLIKKSSHYYGLTVTSYNERKKLIIEKKEFDQDGNIWRKTIYSYDDSDNLIKTEKYDNQNILNDKWIYEYDKNGLKIRADRYTSDLHYYITYVYDNRGNMTALLIHRPDGIETNTYSYIFDSRGNWTSKYENKEDGGPLTKREINYYD